MESFCKVENFINYKEFITFIEAVEKDFIPPLLSRIDPIEYFNKIRSFGIVVKYIIKEDLAGISIMYANNIITRKGFITFVATKKEYRGQHIATLMLNECCKIAKEKGMEALDIETNNHLARACYIKVGFIETSNTPIKGHELRRYYLTKKL